MAGAGTVLDSFVLEFGLDPTKFSQGQKELMEQMKNMLDQQKKAGDQMESIQKKTLDMFSIMRREAVVALGAFFGGREILETVNHFARLETSVARLGATIGMSAQETMAWANAFKAIGSDPQAGLGALATMNAQLTQYDITKQAPAMGIWAALGVDPYDKNRLLKTPETMLLDMAGALERRGGDPRQRAAFMRMSGADEATTQFLLQGTEKVRKLIEEHKKLLPNIDQDIAKLQHYNEELAKFDTAWQRVGMTITDLLAGPLARFFDLVTILLGGDAAPGIKGAGSHENLTKKFGEPPPWVRRMFKGGPLDPDQYPEHNTAAPVAGIAPGSVNEKRSWMGEIFGAQGIDPNIAFQVAASEGLYNPLGDRDAAGNATSFGDFQLHFSGNPKKPALGDIFMKETGLDPRDPTTTRAQYEFIARWVKKHGWGDFHGWKGAPFAGVGRQSSNSSTTNNNVTIHDTSGNPGKTAGLAVEHINRANLAYGVGTVAQG